MGKALNKEGGFTLVELLVVVGIIVALAAVIVPSIVAISGNGEQGAKDSERENIQSAIDTMMEDKGLDSLANPVTLTNATNDMSVFPSPENPLHPQYIEDRYTTSPFWVEIRVVVH